MFKRLFPRLLVVYLSSTLVVIAVLGMILQQLFYGFFYQERVNFLWARTGELAEVLSQHSRGELSSAEWQRILTYFDRASGARLMVLDTQDKLLGDSRPKQALNQRQIKNLARNSQQTGPISLSGRRQQDNPLTTLWVASPVELDNGLVEVVIWQSQAADVMTPLAKARGIILVALLLAGLLAIPMTYLISRRISAPLKALHDHTFNLADGNFSIRVPITTNDEVADLARAFNHMAGRLERFEQTRKDFLATVAHELRTPLTSLQGFIQGLLDGTIPVEDQEYYLSLAFGEVHRLARMVEKLLDLARLQAGQSEFNFQAVDLLTAAREAVDILVPVAVDNGNQIHLEEPAGPVMVQADSDCLQEILLNLISNAIAYSPADLEIRVTIGIEGSMGRIAVADRGQGIPQDHIPYIWERFYRVERSSSNQGFGLGLAIVKSLVEAQGGMIEVQSQPGEGSIFTVYLPLAGDGQAAIP